IVDDHLPRGRRPDADAFTQVLEIERIPFITERILYAPVGGVRGKKQRSGHRFAPGSGKVDEILAVRAIAVQQENELTGRFAVARGSSGTGDHSSTPEFMPIAL